MSSILDKRPAIVDLLKAGNSRQNISKNLKVKKNVGLEALKRYEETGDNQNRLGPRTARTPKLVKSTTEKIWRNHSESGKRFNVSYGTMSTVFRKDLKRSQFKHVKKHQLSAQVVDNDSKDARFFFPAFQMARCQTSFSVIRNSMLNTTLTPKMIKSGRGMEIKDPVLWVGSNVRPQ